VGWPRPGTEAGLARRQACGEEGEEGGLAVLRLLCWLAAGGRLGCVRANQPREHPTLPALPDARTHADACTLPACHAGAASLQDLSDVQWRNFQGGLPQLIALFAALAALSRALCMLSPRPGFKLKDESPKVKVGAQQPASRKSSNGSSSSSGSSASSASGTVRSKGAAEEDRGNGSAVHGDASTDPDSNNIEPYSNSSLGSNRLRAWLHLLFAAGFLSE
jgi:hypothetical protein